MVWSGSLWYPVIAHFVNNATVVSFILYASAGWVDLDLERFGSDTTALAGYISIVVCTVMMLVVKKQFDTPIPAARAKYVSTQARRSRTIIKASSFISEGSSIPLS
jgi:hypothetical protein